MLRAVQRPHVIVLTLVLTTHCAGQQRPETLAQNLLNTVVRGEFLTHDVDEIAGILDQLLTGTKFSAHININRAPKKKFINIYLLAPHLSNRSDLPDAIVKSQIVGNCAFIGITNAIVCDPDLLDNFLDDHKVFREIPESVLPKAQHDFRTAFISWVFGHEIGHLIAGDGGAHFGQDHVLDERRSAVTMQQRRETAADLYSAHLIERNRKLTLSVEQMLIALINEEVAAKVGRSAAYGVGLQWDYADKQIIQYFSNDDHPEFVIRGTRILKQLATGTNDPGLEALVETFSRHLIKVRGD